MSARFFLLVLTCHRIILSMKSTMSCNLVVPFGHLWDPCFSGSKLFSSRNLFTSSVVISVSTFHISVRHFFSLQLLAITLCALVLSFTTSMVLPIVIQHGSQLLISSFKFLYFHILTLNIKAGNRD